MEGDAKGQVGGMEMPEAERRRLAEESRSWTCQGCGGRTNAAILREEGGEASGERRTAEVIPEELKFGFKDQMGQSQGKGKGNETTQDTGPSVNTAETSGSTSSDRILPSTTSETSISPPAPLPATPASQVRQPQPTPIRPPPVPRSNGSPAWLDKTITGVAAALAIMVIKKFAFS